MRIKTNNLDTSKINRIAEFCARTVSPLFQLYGWEYGHGIPKESELKETIEELIIQVITNKSPEVILRTGRFEVTKRISEGETEVEIMLELETIFDYELQEMKFKK